MDGKHRQHDEETDHNTAELLPRNPYCSNDGMYCACRPPHVTFHPQWVTGKPWSLWKTFLACLLACLIATTLVVLVLYFVHFGKPTVNPTIVVHSDGKSGHVTCIPGSTPSPSSSPLTASQSTVPSPPVAHPSSPTTAPPVAITTTKTATTKITTLEHEVLIEDGEEGF